MMGICPLAKECSLMFFKKRNNDLKLDMNNIPKHIGIIMDGNGRWAKSKNLPRTMGHRRGAAVLEEIVKYCDSIGVETVTAYAFSTENWKRPKEEVDALMDLLYDYLMKAEEKFAGKNIVLKVIGDRTPLREDIKSAILRAENLTRNNTGITLNMAINYGGRLEIENAVKEIAKEVKDGKINLSDINENYINDKMYTKGQPELDLIIRPSGELRLSNFMIWQAAYAEFWFNDINWPDFTPKYMEKAIIDYQARNRRRGGL